MRGMEERGTHQPTTVSTAPTRWISRGGRASSLYRERYCCIYIIFLGTVYSWLEGERGNISAIHHMALSGPIRGDMLGYNCWYGLEATKRKQLTIVNFISYWIHDNLRGNYMCTCVHVVRQPKSVAQQLINTCTQSTLQHQGNKCKWADSPPVPQDSPLVPQDSPC